MSVSLSLIMSVSLSITISMPSFDRQKTLRTYFIKIPILKITVIPDDLKSVAQISY